MNRLCKVFQQEDATLKNLNVFSAKKKKKANPTSSLSHGVLKQKKFLDSARASPRVAKHDDDHRTSCPSLPSTSCARSARVFSTPENTHSRGLARVPDSSTECPRHLLMPLILSRLTQRHLAAWLAVRNRHRRTKPLTDLIFKRPSHLPSCLNREKKRNGTEVYDCNIKKILLKSIFFKLFLIFLLCGDNAAECPPPSF